MATNDGQSATAFWQRKFRPILTGKSEAEVSQEIIRSSTLNAIPQLLVWGGVYWYFSVRGPAYVLFGWSGVTLLAWTAYYLWPQSLPKLVPFQFAGVMAINLAATYLLGGLVQSYGQFLWGFLVPMGALVVYGPRPACLWFVGYTALLLGLVPFSSHEPPLLPSTVGHLMTALNMLITGTFVFLGMCYFIARKNHFFNLLKQEQQKSEDLLLNILPADTARALRDTQDTIAASYDEASILFFDLVGFTALSARLGPNATVSMLNIIFSEFDDLVDQSGLEKIKTIGDSYMVAAGLPRHRDDHASAIVSLALELGEVTRRYSRVRGEQIDFRTGIHSGPVTAGVIGKRKFAYDVWGDTVNIASRMESHGIPGRVHISDNTRRLLGDQFEVESRGEIEVKGKGAMQTWIVVGRLG